MRRDNILSTGAVEGGGVAAGADMGGAAGTAAGGAGTAYMAEGGIGEGTFVALVGGVQDVCCVK